jgi:hypothetical protein
MRPKMEPIYQYKLPLPAEQWNVDPKMMGQVSALESFYYLISEQVKYIRLQIYCNEKF